MENKRFLTALDVMEMLGVSLSYSYKLIRRLNAELVKQFMISLLNVLMDKRNVILNTAGIYITRYKSSCIVSYGTFPIHKTNRSFHFENPPLLVGI